MVVVSGSRKRWEVGSIFHPPGSARTMGDGLCHRAPTFYGNLPLVGFSIVNFLFFLTANGLEHEHHSEMRRKINSILGVQNVS